MGEGQGRCKTLESQHRGTRRRIGIGTTAEFSTERERSVSAPAFTALGLPAWGAPGSGDTYNRKYREVVECRAEVGGGVVAMIGVDNITRRSEGPLARCAVKQRSRLVRAEEPRRSLGPIANVVASGMPSVDCLGESRVREKLVHGLGRGERNRADDAQPSRSLGGMSSGAPLAYFTLQENQTPGNVRERLVHVLRLRVPAPEGEEQEHGGNLHGFPPGCLTGEAERNESPGSIMAAPSASEPHP